MAIKQLGKTFSSDQNPLQHKFKGGSPLSTENREINALVNALSSVKKSSKIIQESLSENTKNDDNGTMLDESQLLEE